MLYYYFAQVALQNTKQQLSTFHQIRNQISFINHEMITKRGVFPEGMVGYIAFREWDGYFI